MYLGEIGWDGAAWIQLAHDRDQWWAVVNTVMNLRFLYKAGDLLTSRITTRFSRWSLSALRSHLALPNLFLQNTSLYQTQNI
jgi:hypothetical protein